MGVQEPIANAWDISEEMVENLEVIWAKSFASGLMLLESFPHRGITFDKRSSSSQKTHVNPCPEDKDNVLVLIFSPRLIDVYL